MKILIVRNISDSDLSCDVCLGGFTVEVKVKPNSRLVYSEKDVLVRTSHTKYTTEVKELK